MRILKKIVPIAVTAMIGITMPMAFAQDLANWKGYFTDVTAVIVGANAASVDNIGAVDIATSLSAVSEGADTISGEAEKIEASNNKLNLNESFSGVEVGGFDDTELPTMLADGTFIADDGDDFDYTQKISFGATYPKSTFKKDSDSPTPDEPAIMVYGDDDNQFMNYTQTFVKAAASTNTSGTLDDFEDSSIKLLGETYDIVNADISALKVTLDLMTGAVKSILDEGEEATYTIGDTIYTVKLSIVDDDGKAKFIVNGEASDALSAGQLHKFTFDIELGVTETVRQSWAGGIRQATFYLGAEKLKLEDTAYNAYGMSDYVELDNDNVLDLRHDIVGAWDGTDFTISKIVFYWIPEDEIFVVEDNPTIFPGLGSFKVSTTGLTTAAEEEIKIEPDGSTRLNLIVPIESGVATIDLIYANGTGFLGVGEDATNQLLTVSGATGTFDEDLHEAFIATSTTAWQSYFLKANTYDATNNYVNFIDKVTGQTICENKKAGDTCDVGEVTLTVDLVNVTYNNVTFTITSGAMDKIYTKEGMIIYLPVANSTAVVCNGTTNYRKICDQGNATSFVIDIWEEAPVTEAKETTQFNITLTMTGTAGSRESTVSTIPNGEDKGVLAYKEIGDTNDYAAYSNFSTYFFHKTGGDQDSVIITYPGEEGEVGAYVAEETASIVSTGGVTGSSVVSYLDTEVDETIEAMNLVTIGGSAINSVAADLLGLDYPTYGTDEAWVNATGVDMIGEALVKIMASPYTTGKYAMVVAGYEGTDTRRACLALKEGTPTLSGDSVILSTISEEVVIAS